MDAFWPHKINLIYSAGISPGYDLKNCYKKTRKIKEKEYL